MYINLYKFYVLYNIIQKMRVPQENVQMIMRILSVGMGVYLNTVWMKKSKIKIDEIIFFVVILLALVLGLRALV